jgi:hypothetical protein
MSLDEGALMWLGLIETRKKALDLCSVQLREELKRRKRLTSAKGLAQCAATLAELGAAKEGAERYVEDETRLFFKNVFGILEGDLVALCRPGEPDSPTLIATQLTARLLADGSGVFTVAGDSLLADLMTGLPCPKYLLMHESNGHAFVLQN